MSNNSIIDKINVKGIEYDIRDATAARSAHNHDVGVGLVGSGNAGTSGETYTYKAKLRSETALTVDSAAATTTTSGRVYPVAVDKSGYLSVNVPWTDNNTTYSKATNTKLGLIKPWYSTTGASTYNGNSTAPSAGSDTPSINTRSTTSGRYYIVEMDSNGRAYVNVPWSSVTVDTSLNSSSTNPPQNKAVHSAFSSAVGYDSNYYDFGATGGWRMRQYNATGNSLDIRYGVIDITSQSAIYDVSFIKDFKYTTYTVVFGLYRENAQNWFWSPLVQSKSTSGFKVFVRGNSSGDNGGTLMYIAIRSN